VGEAAWRRNGNEYARCQPRKRRIHSKALGNGIRLCEDPKALQRICDGSRTLSQLPLGLRLGSGPGRAETAAAR